MRETDTALERFQKHFKRGDLVFVGFNDGYSHGELYDFDDDGFDVVQRYSNSTKPIRYSWQHFEVIAHDGFFIRPTKIEKLEYYLIVKDSYDELDAISDKNKLIKKAKEAMIEKSIESVPKQFKSIVKSELEKTPDKDIIPHLEQYLSYGDYNKYTHPFGQIGGVFSKKKRKPALSKDNTYIIGTDDGYNRLKIDFSLLSSYPMKSYNTEDHHLAIRLEGAQTINLMMANDYASLSLLGSDGVDYALRVFSNHDLYIYSNKFNRGEVVRTDKQIKEYLDGKELPQIYTGDPWPLFGKRVNKQTWQHENGACAFVPDNKVLMIGRSL